MARVASTAALVAVLVVLIPACSSFGIAPVLGRVNAKSALVAGKLLRVQSDRLGPPWPTKAKGGSRHVHTRCSVIGCEDSGTGGGEIARRNTGTIGANILLNKRISSSRDTGELCNIISTHAKEFNHVNVATALRKLLQGPPHVLPADKIVEALHTLEERALHQIQDFGPQELSSTLHIVAKKRYRPSQVLHPVY